MLAFVAACAASVPDGRALISAQLEERTGRGIGPGAEPGATSIPDGVVVDDGVTPDDAIALALWNNAEFLDALAELGFRRADLIEAGLLTNPVLSVLFPIGPKQLEFWAKLPLEALWLRPAREAAARLDYERLAAQLVQTGLDLVRDVAQAHADALLANQQAGLANERIASIERIADLQQARLRAGDASGLEASVSRIEVLQATREAERLTRSAQVVTQHWRALLGFAASAVELVPRAGSDAAIAEGNRDELLRTAWASRPDLRAAELAVEAAGERAGLARREFLALTAVLDANDRDGGDVEIGPGVDVRIPLFHFEDGARARTTAEMQRAARRYVAVRHAIARDVGIAHTKLLQAREASVAWSSRILPALVAAHAQSVAAHAAGHTSLLPVLEIRTRVLDARMREARARTDLQRARAELERSIGQRLRGSSDP